MLKIEVFDPQMCCSTGICGSNLDPTLVNFASDLEWLKAQGVEVVRYGLSFEPKKFIENELVNNAIQKSGNSCLPIIIINNKIASSSIYPTREKLAAICKVPYNNDEAPPVHREENCCCGTDCDCGSVKLPEAVGEELSCDCSSAAAEDNCYCGEESDFLPKENIKLKVIVVIVVLLIMTALIATRYFF